MSRPSQPSSGSGPQDSVEGDVAAEVERLLKLKGEERPPEGYVDRFLVEFHVRQRSEMLRSSARGIVWERLSAWLWHPSWRGWRFIAVSAGGLVLLGTAVEGGRRLGGESDAGGSSGRLPATRAGLIVPLATSDEEAREAEDRRKRLARFAPK